MRFNDKAQAAMEFLMIYGWAVLSVLAAIAVLAYFGVLSPTKLLPDQCAMEPGMLCIGSKVETSQITLVLANTAQERVMTITSIDVEGCTGSFNKEMSNGVKETFVLDQSCTNPAPTEKFKGNVKILYTDKASGLQKTVYGSLNTRVEQ